MIADCSVVGGTEGSVAQGVDCPVVGGTGYSAAGGTERFGGTSLVGFANHHPSPLHALLHFCKWGNVVPMSIFCGLLKHYHDLGDYSNFGLFFCFDGWGGSGNWGRNGQSFLVSNKFSDANPVLGQGVSCLTGAPRNVF